MRSAAVGSLIAFHFTLLALGMTRAWSSLPRLRAPLLFYARLTGAGTSFGFFSPNTPREVGISFEIATESGRVLHEELLDAAAPEVRMRVTNMANLLAENFDHERILRSVAASLAASSFRRHPDAVAVTLNADFCGLPDLKSFRAGAKIRPTRVYSATFRRNEP